MQIEFSPEPSTGATTRGKQSKWRIWIKRALSDPVGFSYRALKAFRWKLYFVLPKPILRHSISMGKQAWSTRKLPSQNVLESR